MLIQSQQVVDEINARLAELETDEERIAFVNEINAAFITVAEQLAEARAAAPEEVQNGGLG